MFHGQVIYRLFLCVTRYVCVMLFKTYSVSPIHKIWFLSLSRARHPTKNTRKGAAQTIRLPNMRMWIRLAGNINLHKNVWIS